MTNVRVKRDPMDHAGSVPTDFTFRHRAGSVGHLKELQADIDRPEDEGKIRAATKFLGVTLATRSFGFLKISPMSSP